MTVITQAGNREWVENMARRPHTIQPDALAKNATRLVVETVDDEREIKDQTMTVMLYHVAGNPHSDTMLMAYFPRDRVLVEVDAFSPGSGRTSYAANLLENIQKRKLRVDRIVPAARRDREASRNSERPCAVTSWGTPGVPYRTRST